MIKSSGVQKLFFILIVFTFTACRQKTFKEKLDSLYNNSVTLLTPDELNKKINAGKQFYILDARAKKEYEVSHLKNARWVGYSNFKLKKVKDIPKDADILLYCTVGYRSEKIGEKLKNSGYRHVYNLYGGIINWSNGGHKVFNTDGEQTDRVNTYSKSWSKYLIKGIAVYD